MDHFGFKNAIRDASNKLPKNRHPENQQKVAQKVAEWLHKHPNVKRVIYPGLQNHPDHELAKRQQQGSGAVISFEVKNGKYGAKTVVENTEVCTLAESLGGGYDPD